MITEFLAKEQEPQRESSHPIGEYFLSSPWYDDVIFVLQHLQAPEGMDKTKSRFLKQTLTRFYILNEKLYWKEPVGILLNCMDEHKAKKIIEEFHVG